MTLLRYISLDPAICHGKPCFKGTRVLVHSVLELLASGESPDEILKNAYPQLTKRHIAAALEYAARIAQEGRLLKVGQAPYAVSR